MPLYKAQAAGAAAGAAVGILGLSVKNIGIRAIFTEVVETVFEEITGVPIINDPIDIGQKGAKEGSEAIGKRVKNRLPDKGRGSNNRTSDPAAKGDHSTINDSGNTTYKWNDKNPTGFDEIKRVDKKGKPHTNKDGTKVPTPHVHTKGSKDVKPAIKGKDY